MIMMRKCLQFLFPYDMNIPWICI